MYIRYSSFIPVESRNTDARHYSQVISMLMSLLSLVFLSQTCTRVENMIQTFVYTPLAPCPATTLCSTSAFLPSPSVVFCCGVTCSLSVGTICCSSVAAASTWGLSVGASNRGMYEGTLILFLLPLPNWKNSLLPHQRTSRPLNAS